jgi:hypothetical protein
MVFDRGDGPTPGPEIALEKDHAKKRLFQYCRPKMPQKWSSCYENNENIDINMLPDQTFGQRCLVIQMVDSCIPSSRTPQPLDISKPSK